MNLSRLTITINILLILLGIFFNIVPFSLLCILIMLFIFLIYSFKYLRGSSIDVWKVFFKLYGKRLTLISIPFLLESAEKLNLTFFEKVNLYSD